MVERNKFRIFVSVNKQTLKNMTTSIQQKLDNVATIVACKTINGTSFVGVRNYENSKGEVSNQTFLVGINYGKLLENDLKTLTAFDLAPLLNEYKDNKDVVAKAYQELLTSLTKRTATELEKEILRENGDSTMKRSDAQSDAYETITSGLKSKDDTLFIYGLCVRKTVLKAGEYPTTNSQLKTIIKNKIKKSANLKELKYKQFKLGTTEELQIQGFTI